MTDKPQRFKILRNADPEALAREVSDHLNGVEYVDEKGVQLKFFYVLHGDTRVIENESMAFPAEDDAADLWYEQNVFIHSVYDPSYGATVQPATEAIQ